MGPCPRRYRPRRRACGSAGTADRPPTPLERNQGSGETITSPAARANRTVENSPVSVAFCRWGYRGGQVGLTRSSQSGAELQLPAAAIADGWTRCAPLRCAASARSYARPRHGSAATSRRCSLTARRPAAAAAVDRPTRRCDRSIGCARTAPRANSPRDRRRPNIRSDGERQRARRRQLRKYITPQDVQRVTGLQTVGGQPVLDPTNNIYFLANTDGEPKIRDGETVTLASNFGMPFFGVEGGFLNLTVEYRDRSRTNRTGFDLRPNYVRPTSTTFDPRELTFGRQEFRFGDPHATDYSAFLNVGVPIGAAELYAFAAQSARLVSAANYRQQRRQQWAFEAARQATRSTAGADERASS